MGSKLLFLLQNDQKLEKQLSEIEDLEKDKKKIIKLLETSKVQYQQMYSFLADLVKCKEADLAKAKKDEKKKLLLEIEEDRTFLRELQNDILKAENQIKAYKEE